MLQVKTQQLIDENNKHCPEYGTIIRNIFERRFKIDPQLKMMKLPNEMGEPSSYMAIDHTMKDIIPQNNHQLQVIQIPSHLSNKPSVPQDDFAYTLNLNRNRYIENTIPQAYVPTEYEIQHQNHPNMNQCNYIPNTNLQHLQYTGLKKVEFPHGGSIQQHSVINKTEVNTASDYSDFDLHFLLDKKNANVINTNPVQMGVVPTVDSIEKPQKKLKRKYKKQGETVDPNKPKKKRSKVSTPHEWKKNKQAMLRLAGKEYVGLHGAVKQARSLQPPCESCRMKCSEKIAEDKRQKLFNEFWNMQNWNQRRQYVIARIHQKAPEVHRPRNLKYQKPREFTYFYSFEIDNEDIKVCKRFFLKTLDISHAFIKIAFNKKMATTTTNLQSITEITKPKVLIEDVKLTTDIKKPTLENIKQHIERFPYYECHNNSLNADVKYLGYHLNMRKMYELFVEEMRSQYAKRIPEKKVYSKIFRSDYKFVFNFPNYDNCELCDKTKEELIKTDLQEDKKMELNRILDEHKNEAADRLKLKNDDDYKASNSQKMLVAGLHMHKYLPTPSVPNSESSYLRKLWTLTLIIRDSKGKKSYFVWDETKAGRGANEIGSCIIKWTSEMLEVSNAKEITLWSEILPGHNRNAIYIATYMWILKAFPQIKVINQKFLLAGHPEEDTDYTFITREKKKNDNFEIVTPWDWAQFIRTCKHKHPFKVHNMCLEDFKNIRLLYKAGTSLLTIRAENEAGESYQFNDMVWIQVRADQMGKVFYKTKFSEDQFKSINFRRKIRIARLDLPDELPLLRSDPRAVSFKKFNDLRLHKRWIPSEFHAFYDHLKRNSHVDECPDPNSDDKTFSSNSKAQVQTD